MKIDPRPFTLRQLFLMAEGSRADNWNYWASHLALTANINRDPDKSRAYKVEDFHPYAKREERERGQGGKGFHLAMTAITRKNRFLSHPVKV